MPDTTPPRGPNAASVVAVICASLALIVSAVALGIAINNRGSGGAPVVASAPAVRPQAIAVGEQEYTIAASPDPATPGPARLEITNNGNAAHELILIRTDLADGDLPRTPAGTVDLAASSLSVVGQALDIVAGGTAAVTATLAPGHYVMICNITGHYAAGMHVGLTVQSPGP